MGAPDMLGPDIVGMDMEGRDIGGPDTGGPGIRGKDDMDMGVRGIGAWEGMSGLEAQMGMWTVETVADWLDICWLDIEGGPGMVGMVGPEGGVCWALTALETSSSHLSASEGVRLCPLCICITAETGGGEWSGDSGGTQDEVTGGVRVKM